MADGSQVPMKLQCNFMRTHPACYRAASGPIHCFEFPQDLKLRVAAEVRLRRPNRREIASRHEVVTAVRPQRTGTSTQRGRHFCRPSFSCCFGSLHLWLMESLACSLD